MGMVLTPPSQCHDPPPPDDDDDDDDDEDDPRAAFNTEGRTPRKI